MQKRSFYKPTLPIRIEIVYFKNLTSETEIISGSVAKERATKLQSLSRGKVSRKFEIDKAMCLVELDKDSVTIEIPSGKCQRGHHVLFEISTTAKAERIIKFKSTAVVTSREELDESCDKVSLLMKQYNSEHWQKILQVVDSHQKKTNELFKRMKF